MLSFAKKDLVAIDIGSSAVKLVQLREAKGAYHLVSLGIGYLPPEAIVDNSIMDSSSVVEVIRNLVESHKVKTKNVATSISGHSVIIRKIQLPIMTEEELEASIQWEAEQYIPFEISEVNLDFQILGTDPKDPSQMNVILVAAKKDFVADYVAVFKECGLNPVVMDVDCFAVENAFEVNYGLAEDEIVALVNMGASAVNVNVLKSGVSIFTRDIQVGGNLLTEELQKRLGLSNEEAEKAKMGEPVSATAEAIDEVLLDATENLAQEVQRSLDFFSATSADEKIHKVFITGGVAKIGMVRAAIEKRIGVSVEVVNPFRQVIVNQKNFDLEYVDSVGPIFTVAAGLAMRRVGDK
jgi:type IV pilus assembly protein PilM